MIRFGLLGCGHVAKRQSELLGGGRIDRASLIAVCDPIRARADAIGSKFGVPEHYDIDDFLARKDMDAVAVLTPSGMHPEHVIACAGPIRSRHISKSVCQFLVRHIGPRYAERTLSIDCDTITADRSSRCTPSAQRNSPREKSTRSHRSGAANLA
jgi:hypothetical protein